ncbi:hypothetical protein AnigIFM60653_009375 [Aspergillus niger]|nr:hypothetical protein AnigIFM60653_009375 [Aspergillus niger]
MGSIAYTQFQTTLRTAVEQKSQQYENIYSIAVRWELDDTNAHEDTERFQDMLQSLDTGPAEVLVLRSDDQMPEFTLVKAWIKFSTQARLTPERSLIIFHYAGHGASKDGSFTITDNRMESKTINFQNTILDEVKNPARFMNTDFLFIFDCCFAHYATRAPETTGNIIEILAATSSETVEARCAADNTFTAKLANEIARRQRANHDIVDFASVFQSIRARSTVRVTPTHALLVGATSVTLPLNGHKLVDPQAIPADYTALFSVNVSRDVTAQEMKELVAWMRELPPFAGLKIESVYRTQSTCFIMHAALSVYAKLHSMQGYTLIAENPGPRLNHLLQLEPSEEPTQSHVHSTIC